MGAAVVLLSVGVIVVGERVVGDSVVGAKDVGDSVVGAGVGQSSASCDDEEDDDILWTVYVCWLDCSVVQVCRS